MKDRPSSQRLGGLCHARRYLRSQNNGLIDCRVIEKGTCGPTGAGRKQENKEHATQMQRCSVAGASLVGALQRPLMLSYDLSLILDEGVASCLCLSVGMEPEGLELCWSEAQSLECAKKLHVLDLSPCLERRVYWYCPSCSRGGSSALRDARALEPSCLPTRWRARTQAVQATD